MIIKLKEKSIVKSASFNKDIDLLSMYDDYLDRWIAVDNELRSFEEFVEDYYKSLEIK